MPAPAAEHRGTAFHDRSGEFGDKLQGEHNGTYTDRYLSPDTVAVSWNVNATLILDHSDTEKVYH